METTRHALLSLGIGTVLAIQYHTPLYLGYALALGTLIDLDHFLIARYRTGTWNALTTAITNPRTGIVNQANLFEEGAVWSVKRIILGHIAELVVLTFLAATVSRPLALVTGVTLGGHVALDILDEL